MDNLMELPVKLASMFMALATILLMLNGGGGSPPKGGAAAMAQLAFPFMETLDKEYAKATPYRGLATLKWARGK